MLRLIHNQTVLGAILVDDIDDGLPNKQVHRLGSTADPKAYKRDGYANEPKQPCYVPYTVIGNAAVAGYIDLNETQRVLLSEGKGKISKLVQAGLLSKLNFAAGATAAPAITNAQSNTPSLGAVTLTGTGFTSTSPNVSSVKLTGTGAVTLTQSQITGAGGTFSSTSIVIPSSLIPNVVAATGTITAVSGANLNDGETFTLNDGVNSATVFEFDSGGGVTGGHVAVPFTSGDSAATVAASIITAINGVAGSLAITASPGTGAVVNLTNDALGSAGDHAITKTVANSGFIVTGMSGGGGAVATATSAQVIANAQTSNVFALV